MSRVFGSKEEVIKSEYIDDPTDKIFSVEQLALYGTSDWIVGSLYHPALKIIPENVTLVPVPGGHLFVSYNIIAMRIALDFLIEQKA
jgi:hypothetical protein